MDNIKERLKEYNKFSKELRPKFPENMLIELTNICNHKCIFCANRKMTRKKGRIEKELVYKILEEAFSLGTREVGFYATGEPMIDPNISEYIKLAKDIGYTYTYITTNGALATPERSIKLIESGIDSIKFSINAGKKDTYKIIHGTDEFESVIENLKFISRYIQDNDKSTKLYVSYVVTRQNEDEKQILINMVGQYVNDIVFANVRNQGGLMYELNEELTLVDDAFSKRSAPCSLLFKSLHITYEGYLSACCVDFQNYLTVADLNKCTLDEAWNNNIFVGLRKQHMENKIQNNLCYNCLYNKNEEVNPLILEHSTIYKRKSFSVLEDIRQRVKK